MNASQWEHYLKFLLGTDFLNDCFYSLTNVSVLVFTPVSPTQMLPQEENLPHII